MVHPIRPTPTCMSSPRAQLGPSFARVRVFTRPYDPVTGETGEREVLIQFDDGYPDGMCIDADDHLWIAFWVAARCAAIAHPGSVSVASVFPPEHDLSRFRRAESRRPRDHDGHAGSHTRRSGALSRLRRALHRHAGRARGCPGALERQRPMKEVQHETAAHRRHRQREAGGPCF